MQTWLSIHFFPTATQNAFLVGQLHPFLGQQVWPVAGTRFFYIRYSDADGPHLRLRFRGTEEWLSGVLRPALEPLLSAEGHWKVLDYVPEPARFGGEAALPWAEEHFHISSRVALDRINRDNYVYGDTLFDAMRLHVSAAFAAGLTVDQSSAYFDGLCNQWIGAFFSPADDAMDAALLRKEVRADFDKTLDPQFAFLQDALRQMYRALQDQQFDVKQPEWLRWFRGNELIFKELGKDLEKALPSLLHLTNNRLGVNNQDEAYLLFVLGKVLS